MDTGDTVPDFEATTDSGDTITLSGLLADGPVVLFFYPKADTAGCTAQACHFRDLGAEFEAAGAQRIGISADSVKSQRRFREKNDFDYPLIADTSGEIARIFGTKRAGPLPPRRQTFVIDTDFTVLERIASEVDMDVHADRALAVLQAAKATG
ncbi:MAG: peroxiredoxin [Nitriliruptorales bacterium]|nr:peroxiredoxin [Nitriliruptorales bacterium]